jgi:hypothetical protein
MVEHAFSITDVVEWDCTYLQLIKPERQCYSVPNFFIISLVPLLGACPERRSSEVKVRGTHSVLNNKCV